MILSLGFFYILYCSNNKYMTREDKAIHGILYVEGDYDDLPVYYLSREWEYYPDVLLTPEDDLEEYYCRYLSIGEYGGMELDQKGPFALWEWDIPAAAGASRGRAYLWSVSAGNFFFL